MRKVAQDRLQYNSPKELVELVNSQRKANLREPKQRLLEEALEFLVEKYLGQKWLKIKKASPTPWTCLNCGPRSSYCSVL